MQCQKKAAQIVELYRMTKQWKSHSYIVILQLSFYDLLHWCAVDVERSLRDYSIKFLTWGGKKIYVYFLHEYVGWDIFFSQLLVRTEWFRGTQCAVELSELQEPKASFHDWKILLIFHSFLASSQLFHISDMLHSDSEQKWIMWTQSGTESSFQQFLPST